jgi:small subunit ribosomal protein S21
VDENSMRDAAGKALYRARGAAPIHRGIMSLPMVSHVAAKLGFDSPALVATDAKKAVDEAAAGRRSYRFSVHDLSIYVRHMSIEIKIRKNEPIDRALRRMKKKLDRENIIKGTRAKRYYEKPCERRRRKEKVQAFTQMLRRRYAE